MVRQGKSVSFCQCWPRKPNDFTGITKAARQQWSNKNCGTKLLSCTNVINMKVSRGIQLLVFWYEGCWMCPPPPPSRESSVWHIGQSWRIEFAIVSHPVECTPALWCRSTMWCSASQRVKGKNRALNEVHTHSRRNSFYQPDLNYCTYILSFFI
jgi:hypothetical protein